MSITDRSHVLLPIEAPLGPVPLAPLPTRPLVSIIVPSFNQGRFIRATIDSILAQEYRPIEVHVIDGGSRDETVDVLRSYPDTPELNWISEPDNGVVHAVNKGFARVRGDVVGIQSSDDMYLPGALSRIVKEFQDRPAVGLIYGDTVKVDADGRELQRYRIGPYSLENIFLCKTWIPQPSAFFRRELLDALGGWDERIPYAPDTDLWIRMAFRTEVVKLDHYLSQRRMHDAQRDTQAAKIVRDFCKMIDQSRDLPHAPQNVRRAARAARHLIRLRYQAGDGDWTTAWHLLRAGLITPHAWNGTGFLHHLCLPVRRLLSAVKQRLTGSASTARRSTQPVGH